MKSSLLPNSPFSSNSPLPDIPSFARCLKSKSLWRNDVKPSLSPISPIYSPFAKIDSEILSNLPFSLLRAFLGISHSHYRRNQKKRPYNSKNLSIMYVPEKDGPGLLEVQVKTWVEVKRSGEKNWYVHGIARVALIFSSVMYCAIPVCMNDAFTRATIRCRVTDLFKHPSPSANRKHSQKT